ncbi:hypothetical protein CDD82_7299 [Ophiocordyceps australis]|uniref:MFS maltose permease n=1 Tax=Ophiocordyceps australis TaxID=1399860 RepID=A0A2C5YS60_9HYPO|nr:hypothetical protein CDD82_7299 [Ophiocordyceps australis]
MRPRLHRLKLPSPLLGSNLLHHGPLVHHAKLTCSRARPNLPFLATPNAKSALASRSYTSDKRQWLKHEAKLVVRYTLSLWGIACCFLCIWFFIGEEINEREFPTPHDWPFLTRKYLRDANLFKSPSDGQVDWPKALQLSRLVVLYLEDRKKGGKDVVKFRNKKKKMSPQDREFISCDISAMPEEWRRGYYEAIMLAAKAAEHLDGWVRDRSRNIVSPPEYVIGPSNPRPAPIPPKSAHAPRQEDCEIAYPVADNWYLKILATEGFTARQKMNAALEYASFSEFKGQTEGADALYNLALAEASQGIAPEDLPYDPKTLVMKSDATSPSQNVLDALTAIATSKARRGDVTCALPIFISLLRARRSLSNTRPKPTSKPKKLKDYEMIMQFFAQPPYPPPPPDGTQTPWRDVGERCQEASLSLYIGEILFSQSPGGEGLAWTRDSVDLSEEQLRRLSRQEEDKEAKHTCRQCLVSGLDNWAVMVSRLARMEEEQKKSSSQPSPFSLWKRREDDGRWEAEQAVVEERKRRTRELVEDLKPSSTSFWSFLKA